jgi:glycosyltransferase involved in cell wall biosynthesis
MLKCHNKKITWLGSIEDRNEIVKRLMSAYMIVLPSRWEGLPLTLFESLASGRPVIVSDIPAFKSVVTDNNNAVFFESENEKDLNLKIFKLIDNSIFADEIGKEGKKLAEQYDWNMIAEKTKEIYG